MHNGNECVQKLDGCRVTPDNLWAEHGQQKEIWLRKLGIRHLNGHFNRKNDGNSPVDFLVGHLNHVRG